jgi:hypothetical protein
VHEVIFMVLGPINQVATPCSFVPNPKRFKSTNCYPNINLRGGVIKVEANFFDLNAELKTVLKSQILVKQI